MDVTVEIYTRFETVNLEKKSLHQFLITLFYMSRKVVLAMLQQCYDNEKI